MNKTLKIIITLVIVAVIGCLVYSKYFSKDSSIDLPVALLQECPDELIINRMPGTSPQSSYYIVNGERREIAEYDAVWVEANCTIPSQEVY